MENIESVVKKVRERVLQGQTKNVTRAKRVASALHLTIGADVANNEVSFAKKRVFVRGGASLKSEIFLHKKEILEHCEKQGIRSKHTPNDIR